MKRARVSVVPPPGATSEVHLAVQSVDGLGDAVLLSGGTDPDDPTELFSIDGDADTAMAALEDREGVRSASLLSAEGGTTYVHVREAGQESTVGDAFTADTLVVTLPVAFRADGSVEFTVLGAGSDLRSAVETVRQFAAVTVLSVRDGWDDDAGGALTDRQAEVLSAAHDAGYYDYPRGATQGAVADRLDVAASTVAEHLRKAEATLVERAIGEE